MRLTIDPWLSPGERGEKGGPLLWHKTISGKGGSEEGDKNPFRPPSYRVSSVSLFSLFLKFRVIPSEAQSCQRGIVAGFEHLLFSLVDGLGTPKKERLVAGSRAKKTCETGFSSSPPTFMCVCVEHIYITPHHLIPLPLFLHPISSSSFSFFGAAHYSIFSRARSKEYLFSSPLFSLFAVASPSSSPLSALLKEIGLIRPPSLSLPSEEEDGATLLLSSYAEILPLR